MACGGTWVPTLCAGRWRRGGGQKLAVTKDRMHGFMSVRRDVVARLKRSRRLFPAANAIIPCGRRDYSRLAAIAGGGRVRIQQSEPKELFGVQASPGVTTLLFTDIEGSTRLWEQEGDKMS